MAEGQTKMEDVRTITVPADQGHWDPGYKYILYASPSSRWLAKQQGLKNQDDQTAARPTASTLLVGP